MPQTRRAPVAPLILSIAILATGMFWTYRVGLRANAADHELFHLQMNLDGIRKHVAEMEHTR